MEIIPKITMKTIDAQPAPRSVEVKKDLAHIYGRADRVNEGSTTYGIFHKYKGMFKAMNLETGEVFQSSNLLLPEIADSILLEGMLAAGATLGKEKTGKDAEQVGEKVKGDPVEFALCIGVIPMDSKDGTGRGYQFTAKPLFESKAADPLAAIEARLKTIPQIAAAPKAEQVKVEDHKGQKKK
jgi:hypothetical protein